MYVLYVCYRRLLAGFIYRSHVFVLNIMLWLYTLLGTTVVC